MTHPVGGPGPVPPRFNIARYCLEENARLRPDKPALIVAGTGGEETRWSFAAFYESVTALGAGLRDMSLPDQARVVIHHDDSARFALAFFGTIAAGLIAVPTSELLSEPELWRIVEDSGASLLIVADGLAPEGPPPRACRVIADDAIAEIAEASGPGYLADTAADDPAFLVYTSGTSGAPKGVLHGQRTAWGRRPMIEGWTGICETDRVLHAGRLNWTYSMGVGLIDPWSRGATALLYDGEKDPCVWPRLIERFKATIFVSVPSVYRQMIKYCRMDGYDLASLRHGITAGEPLRPELLDRWRQATGTELYESLGMSEISTYISSGPTTPVRPGSPGRPQPGRRIAILPVDGGEQALPAGEVGLLGVHRSDPGLMLRYWRSLDIDAEHFRGEWFLGGDLAELDSDGYVRFHGRNDEVMNAMGYRVSPLEVEAVLTAHPAILEAAATELAVRADVSVIAAFVVAQEPGALSVEAIEAWCAGRLADYKRPREIRFVDELPRSATGKLMRRRLAEQAQNEAALTLHS